MVKNSLERIGFVRNENDWYLYRRYDQDGIHFLIVHVADFLLFPRKATKFIFK